jgi:hypothetical protein
MTNKITADLFTNAAFTQAFRASLRNPVQKVVYNGVSWKVGGQEFMIGPEKLHSIRTCFLKIAHKFRVHCSYQYCKNYKRTIKKFATAQFKEWPRKVAKTASVAYRDMKMHVYCVKDLPEKIEREVNAVAKCQAAIEQGRAFQQNLLLESPNMKATLSRKNLLEQLKASLKDYIDQRIKKENPDAWDQAKGQASDFLNRLIPNIIHVAAENTLGPELSALAKNILDPIPLSLKNRQDSEPFEKEIEKKRAESRVHEDQIMNGVDLTQLQNNLRAHQEQLERLRIEQAQAPEIISQIAQRYDDTKLLSSPPQSPQKAATQKVVPKPEKLSHMESFLIELEKVSSPQMRALWDSLLSNLVQKYGKDVIKSFRKNKDNSLKITFKQPLKLYMLPCNSKGEESAKRDPQGGSILNFGDERSNSVTFSASVGTKNLVNITGLKSWARIPKRYEWAIPLVGEYTQVDLPSMEVKENQLIITAFKKVLLRSETIKRSTPVDALKKHWREHGEIVKIAEESFLKSKRTELLSKNRITA